VDACRSQATRPRKLWLEEAVIHRLPIGTLDVTCMGPSVGAAGIDASVLLAMGDGSWRRDPRQARRHAGHAGRGHRRGLDGPSMPNPLSKPGSISLRQPTKLPSDRSGGGRCAGEHATWAGTRDGWFRFPKCGPDTARGQHIEESPLNPAVQAGFRWPLSRSNAPRPTCRSRYARTREATNAPTRSAPAPTPTRSDKRRPARTTPNRT